MELSLQVVAVTMFIVVASVGAGAGIRVIEMLTRPIKDAALNPLTKD